MSKLGQVITPGRILFLLICLGLFILVAASVAADGEIYLPTIMAPPPDDSYPPMGWVSIRPDQLPGRPAACPKYNGPIDGDNCGILCVYIDEGIPDWAGTGGIPVGPNAVDPGTPESGLLDPQFELSCMAFIFDLGG